VQLNLLVFRVGRVSVSLPISRIGVDLDGAPLRFPTVNAYGCIDKVRPGDPVPDAKLHDPHCLSVRTHKIPPELAGKPAGLEFQFTG
jgi:hypothetical protein